MFPNLGLYKNVFQFTSPKFFQMNEITRLEDLESYKILNAQPEKELDDLTTIASLMYNTPISLITFLDEDQQWLQSKVGLLENHTSRKDAICQHTLGDPNEVLVINDLTRDDRFENNSLVQDKGFRFYAGAPLTTPKGNVLGTLCIIDHKPRTITPQQKEALQLLADKAMNFLNYRKKVLSQEHKIRNNILKLRKLTDNIPGGIFQFKRTVSGNMEFEFISKGLARFHSAEQIQEIKKNPAEALTLMHPEDIPRFTKKFEASYESLTNIYEEYRVKTKEGWKWHSVKASPEEIEKGTVVWYGSFQDITNHIRYEEDLEQIAFDISHVLRGPIANLVGLSNSIENEQNLERKVLYEYLDYIREASSQLDQYTRDLNIIYEKKKDLYKLERS